MKQNNKSVEEIVEELDSAHRRYEQTANYSAWVEDATHIITHHTTQIRKEAVEEIKKLRNLLKECEPFLSDGTEVGIIDLVYRSPLQQMREAADRMEYEADLKRRVQETLTNSNDTKV